MSHFGLGLPPCWLCLHHKAVNEFFCCWYAVVVPWTVLAWPIGWWPDKPSCVGLTDYVPRLCVSLPWPLSLEESCPTRGWQCAERLMSTLAYGWVECCSDIVGCGRVLHWKISAVVTSSLQFIYCSMRNDEHVNAGMYVCFRCMIEELCICASCYGSC